MNPRDGIGFNTMQGATYHERAAGMAAAGDSEWRITRALPTHAESGAIE